MFLRSFSLRPVFVACSSSDGGTTTGNDAAGDTAVVTDTGSAGDTIALDTAVADTTPADTAPAKCDPAGSTACVACGTESCGSGKICCGSGSGRACATSCDAGGGESCDGPEDCTSGACCVNANVKFTSTSSATTTCGSTCPTEAGSTGSGAIIKSPSCRAKADCAGVVGSFGVPYGHCCHAKDLDVGVCVSDTYASQLKTDGGATCD